MTPGLMGGPVNGVEPTADLRLDIGHRALRGSAAAPRLRTLRRSRQSGTSTSAATSTRRVLSTRPVGSSVAGGRRMSSTSPRVTVPARPAAVATGDREGVRRRWRQRLAREGRAVSLHREIGFEREDPRVQKPYEVGSDRRLSALWGRWLSRRRTARLPRRSSHLCTC